jgi:hypothetical protein
MTMIATLPRPLRPWNGQRRERCTSSAPARIQKISPVGQPVVLPAQGTKEVF